MHPFPLSASELWTYRALCLIGGALVPLLGYGSEAVGIPVVDPLWARWAISALPIGVCAGSFVSEAVRREISGLTYVLLYVLIGWYGVAAWAHGLTAEYAVGGVCVLVAVFVVGSVGSKRLLPLGMALATAWAVMAAVALAVAAPGIRPVAFIGIAAACAAGLFGASLLHLRLRKRLTQSERRYRSIFDQVTDGVLLLEAGTLQVIAANASYCRLSGFEAKELRAYTLYDLANARPDAVDRDATRAIESGHADLGERTHLRRDGTALPLHVTLARVDRNGPPHLCLIVCDLTVQQRARAEVTAARVHTEAMLELRNTFLNSMNHELRTPLVALIGFLDLLEEEGIDPEERSEIVASLRRSTHRLHSTLNNVLDLAQLDSGHANLTAEAVEVGDATREAALLFHDEAQSKGVALEFRMAEPARALVDRAAFHRIIASLVSNAVKFTPAGRVDVEVGADSHRVFVRVRDTGVGIPEAFLPHLFGAFRQNSTGLSREHEGSGLGLTIAKRFVDRMGGRIMVESAEGRGTSVTVAFARTWTSPEPALDHHPHAPVSDGPPPGMPDAVTPLAARPRALVVEDNADTARLVERLIRNTFEVDIAPDGRTALDMARRTWYDVLLLDINLGPGIDGISVLRRLRAMSAYAYVPVVAVTTYTAPGDRERFLSSGFNAYLPKPFDRKSLLAAVEHAYGACAQEAA